jgi:hypothetical protein
MIRFFVLAVLLTAGATRAAAQTPPGAMDHEQHAMGTAGLYPAREASGTSWSPALTPMSGVMRDWRGWSLMTHGALFGQLVVEPGDRHRTGGTSNHQISSVNWAMAMARRNLGGGRFGIRVMGSAEPWTVRDCGFINLLATGEMCEGDTIHDRQHPHDLFMELAAEYDHSLRGSLRWQLYAGLAGEPALGPIAFPHRLSARANPVAPIGHHWMDATHITFGVITAGIYDERWKAEASVFNGREPDDRRTGLDLGPLDSVSGRLSFMPSEQLALQLSAAHLEEAEDEFPPEPRADVERLSASATYHRRVGTWFSATTLAYGLNAGLEIVPADKVRLVTHAAMLESSFGRVDRETWFGRIEIVGKPAHDLHAHEYPTAVFTVGKVQVGYERALGTWRSLVAGAGATAAVSLLPAELSSRYSGRVAPGFGVYLSLRPRSHIM